MASIAYRRIETTVLTAGSGIDAFDIRATHREQSVSGLSSSFTINAGDGDDRATLGYLAGLDGFALDLDTPLGNENDGWYRGGTPIFFNGQDGRDHVQFDDSSRTIATTLSFQQRTFAEIFPSDPQTAPPTASAW